MTMIEKADIVANVDTKRPDSHALLQEALVFIKHRNYAEAARLGARILELDPSNGPGTHILGLSHLRLRDWSKALPLLQKVVRSNPQHGPAHWQFAQALHLAGHHMKAIQHFDRAQDLGITDKQLEVQRYEAAGKAFQHNCNWRQYDRIQRLARTSILTSRPWLVGESGLASSYFSNAVLLRASKKHAAMVMADVPKTLAFRHAPPESRVRLGFVGCDFFNQATAYLMTGFIESLDRSRFEVFAYDHAASSADSPIRARIQRAYDHFVVITDLSDEEAAARIHRDRIDILLSIKNPASARLRVFARRPSAIQVHYLYYPGTSGMPFFDYIIADDVIIPSGAESAYSEKVLRLPGCYQPNDSNRVRAKDTRREEWGLPEKAVILANFSQTYKYTPEMFDLWCMLLSRDRNRILWLLCNDVKIRKRLLREARARDIGPQQIYFTSSMPSQAHLNRLRHADLVVDTYPYGGHTLTSDALWAATPVVTRCGETFASRVAASLLQDVGMGELVAAGELEFLEKAEFLLSDPGRLRAWRQHLDQGRERFALFDSKAYARKFETAMITLIDEHWRKDRGNAGVDGCNAAEPGAGRCTTPMTPKPDHAHVATRPREMGMEVN